MISNIPTCGTKPNPGVMLNPLHPLSRGLIGYWLFNEGAGSRVNDISGHGNPGTLKNMLPNVQGSGWGGSTSGGGLWFDGNNDYVDCGEKIAVENTDLTVVTQIYLNDVTVDQRAILTKYDVAANAKKSFMFRINTNGAVDFFTHDGTTQSFKRTAYNSVTINNWYTAAVVYDDSANDATIYVDGVALPNSLQDDVLSNIQDTTTNLTIGSWVSANDRMDGSIDYIFMYDRKLLASDIEQLHHNPFCNLLTPRRWYAPGVGNPYWYYNMLRSRR